MTAMSYVDVCKTQDILHFSIVTSGRHLRDDEVDAMCDAPDGTHC